MFFAIGYMRFTHKRPLLYYYMILNDQRTISMLSLLPTKQYP